jgi:hypothetical protein
MYFGDFFIFPLSSTMKDHDISETGWLRLHVWHYIWRQQDLLLSLGLKVPRLCPLVLLIEVHLRGGEALGSEKIWSQKKSEPGFLLRMIGINFYITLEELYYRMKLSFGRAACEASSAKSRKIKGANITTGQCNSATSVYASAIRFHKRENIYLQENPGSKHATDW